MSHAFAARQPPPGQWLRLSGVDWQTYSRLLHAFAERPRIRLTYDRGELEFLAPPLDRDDAGRILGVLVFVLTEEMGLPLKRGGSTTLRRRLRRRGIDPDESFWIANAYRMAGRRRLDLRTDPPTIPCFIRLGRRSRWPLGRRWTPQRPRTSATRRGKRSWRRSTRSVRARVRGAC